jgi:hypothetical protein
VTAALDEPEEICAESVFQSALVRVLEEISGDWSTVLVQSFVLDVAMFLNGPGGGKVRFLEVKSFGGQRMGGVGFGNQLGEGRRLIAAERTAGYRPLGFICSLGLCVEVR